MRGWGHADLMIPGGRVHEPLEFGTTEASLNCVIATRHGIGYNPRHGVERDVIDAEAPNKVVDVGDRFLVGLRGKQAF